MAKILSAKEKAIELGISMRALAKTRHLYRHIPKSPRKFLYFEEEPKEAVRPFTPEGSDGSVKSRSNRRRNVPFGQENYHKAPGGSGNSLQTLNQMRGRRRPLRAKSNRRSSIIWTRLWQPILKKMPKRLLSARD